VAEGVVCDFSDKEPNATVSRAELVEQAERYDLAAGEYLILDCGMAPEDTDRYKRNFVYPDEDAVEYMIETDIACLAIDAPSADKQGAPFEELYAHYGLLGEDILIVEFVDNLSTVSAGRYDVVCTPIPYENRDGSQVRLLVRPQD